VEKYHCRCKGENRTKVLMYRKKERQKFTRLMVEEVWTVWEKNAAVSSTKDRGVKNQTNTGRLGSPAKRDKH